MIATTEDRNALSLGDFVDDKKQESRDPKYLSWKSKKIEALLKPEILDTRELPDPYYPEWKRERIEALRKAVYAVNSEEIVAGSWDYIRAGLRDVHVIVETVAMFSEMADMPESREVVEKQHHVQHLQSPQDTR